MARVRLSRQGAIKLVRDFQTNAGLGEADVRGLASIMAVNNAFVRDAEGGLVYCVSKGGSRLNLADLYEAHLERATELRQIYQPREMHQVDDMALENIKRYLNARGVAAKDNSDLVTAAISLAYVFYEHFGTGVQGAMHIPVVDSKNLLKSKYSHIHLKL